MDAGLGVFVEDKLGDAFAIAQVNENHPAQIAAAKDPAQEQRFLAGIGGAPLAAVVGAAEIA